MRWLRGDTSGHDAAAKSTSVPNAFSTDQRVDANLARGNVGLETTAPFAIEFPLSTRGRRRPTHAGRLVEPSRTQCCTRAFRKNVFACTIAARAAGVSARALSMTKSWIVPLYRVEVTVTPATMSLLA